MSTPKDESHCLLFLGKLSRDKLGYMQSKQQALIPWSTLKNLELAFFEKYPNLKSDYDTFMISESKKWQKLFGLQFKIHSFSEFVFANKDQINFIY